MTIASAVAPPSARAAAAFPRPCRSRAPLRPSRALAGAHTSAAQKGLP
jgi:hypothetical protein